MRGAYRTTLRVFLTGSARGIGRATALTFARDGAAVFVTDGCHGSAAPHYPMATGDDLVAVANACTEAGARSVASAALDVRSSSEVRAVIDDAVERLGGIDVLVNAAGVIGPSKRADLLGDDDWQYVLDTNLTGAWRCAREVARHLIESRRAGAIVNVASTAGLVAFPHFSNYVASKHALIGLTRALALDFAPFGIRVNAVCPTSVRPQDSTASMLAGVAAMLDLTLDEYEKLALPQHPQGRLPRADDVADAVVWLACDAARSITGTALPVDAGFTAR